VLDGGHPADSQVLVGATTVKIYVLLLGITRGETDFTQQQGGIAATGVLKWVARLVSSQAWIEIRISRSTVI
jgi:hypothetical protein